MSESITNSDVPEIPDHVAENYRALVADPNRTETFASISKDAKRSGDPALAAWARRQAKTAGKDVTPDNATSDIADQKRDAAPSDGAKPSDKPNYDEKTVAELKQLVEDRNLDATGLNLKADYVAALELADGN